MLSAWGNVVECRMPDLLGGKVHGWAVAGKVGLKGEKSCRVSPMKSLAQMSGR